eukprot:tig00000630_g2679.t1
MPVIPGHPFACDFPFRVRTPQDKNGDACVLIMTHEVWRRSGTKGYMNTCYIQGRLPDGIEEAAANHLADNGYVTPDEIGYAGGRSSTPSTHRRAVATSATSPVFDRAPRAEFDGAGGGRQLQYCGVIKGQKSTGLGLLGARREEALCMMMAEGLDLKACTEEELKMRSGDAYARNFKFAQGNDRRCKAPAQVACD